MSIKDENIPLFKPNKQLGGYDLAIQDNWAYTIRRTNIGEKYKDIYLEEFGETIIKEAEFNDWWCRIKEKELGRKLY